MIEIGPQHPLSYRKEILAPLFARIQSAESCAVIGAASMGKTRLLDFIMRPDVQEHYLGEQQAAQTLFVRVDCNRMYEFNQWGFYELLLMAVAEACGQQSEASLLRPQINNLQAQVISSRDALVALRFFELVVLQLCAEKKFRLCFLLDEFDEVYRDFEKQVFAQLRAVRDANKNLLNYVIFLRAMPQQLHSPKDIESFYELFSRSLIGLTPYTVEDLTIIQQQLEARRLHEFAPEMRDWMIRLSGGHPGLLHALFDTALERQGRPVPINDPQWLSSQPKIVEECRKLQESLPEEEWLALIGVARGVEIAPAMRETLHLKGLVRIREAGDELFTPLLSAYALRVSDEMAQVLRVDPANHTVWIGNRRVQDLANLEFKLLEFLYQNRNSVCRREEIMLAIYGDPGDLQDSRLDRLVNRLRQAVEPDPENPRFLITIRGVGFKLET